MARTRTFTSAGRQLNRGLAPMTPKLFLTKASRRVMGMIRWEQRLNAWEARSFDRRLGVDTGGKVEPADLTVPAGDVRSGITYFGTQPRLARWWLSGLPANHQDFTFIDMGSGKARVLLIAAEAGFARSIGVEFAQELHLTAVENASAARRHGLAIEPVLGDAGVFAFPDEPLVVHFNNPFAEPVMKRVIANLADVIRATSPSPGRCLSADDFRAAGTRHRQHQTPRPGPVHDGANTCASEGLRRSAPSRAVHRADLRVP